MPPKPIAGVTRSEPYKGGESTLPGFAHPVKLSSNENALGASPRALEAFAKAAADVHLYPEGGATALRRAIGERYGLDPARIVCGAGSDELFLLLARAYLEPGDDIVQSEYAFLIYAIAAKVAGAEIRVAKDRGHTVDVDAMLAQVGPRTKLVFIANPNNPTGTYVPYAELKRLHAGLPENVLLVIDAAYAEYVRNNDYSAGIELASEFPNVLMTRTFSKIYGLAALRVGWGYGPPDVVDTLNRVRGPFNVSIPAQRAAAAAIADTDFVDRTVAHNSAELARVETALTEMGLNITPSVANFALVHFSEAPGKTAIDADNALRKRGYILRRLDGYGLPNALRFTIGLAHDNDGVLDVLREFLRA
jgi:histidinol-phosphate aminotransferase